jgi:serine/threonine protein kinase
MSFVIGENVGPYRITDRLGQGGMATVYRAYHANLDRYVAIKVLHASFKEDPTFLARFRREAQIVAKLEHPSIIPIYDYNEHSGEPYLVMKFIEGETLKARLAREPLTLDETLRMMTAVSQALTYAHEQGILHRDIKPSNILLENAVQPYLADFGLARMASAGESTMSQDMMLGTPQYMSPEQAQGIKELDSGTDIYSLGVVLYELVVGRVPFNADTPYAIVHDHIYSPLPLPSRVNPQVPRAVEQVLLKTLAKERGDRYSSAVAMVEAFREAVRESDLKELSAHSYRVPMPSAATPQLTSTPPPAPPPGVPAPIPAAAPTESLGSTAQKYARQRQRRNLWMLGGFAGLIATCLTGLFVTVSAFSDATIRASLFVPRPSQAATRVGVVPTPTAQPTVQVSIAPTTQSTTPPTAAPTTGQTAEPTTVDATDAADASTDSTLPTAAPGGLSLAEAQKRVADNPTDPLARFALAAALGRDGKPGRAQQEFAEGLRLGKDQPALLFEAAQLMSMQINGAANPSLALVYAYAYAAGAGSDASIRSEAGQYLYRFLKNGRKRDVLVYKKMEGAAVDKQSAGLYALLALAYDAAGQPDSMREMMDQAQKLDENLPEVRLVRGILLLGRRPLEARKELAAAGSAPDAPSWIAEEARTLAQRGS